MIHTLRNKIRLPKTISHRQRAGLIVGLAFVGVGATLLTQAAISSVSVELEDGTRSANVSPFPSSTASGGNAIQFGTKGATACGKQVQNYNYQVPFGNAVWNQPVCNLPRHPQSADYASRFFEWSSINDGSPKFDVNNGKLRNDPGFPDPTRINPLDLLFTREVYYASKATTETQIGTISYYSNLDRDGDQTFTPNAKIPWNPGWQASQAGDNEMIILDDRPGPTQGRIYFLSGYYPSSPGFPYRRIPPIGCLVYFQQNRLCTYNTTVARDLAGNHVDYRTYEGFVKNRGVGLSFLATLTLPEEVEAGEIRHALGISIPNTSYGPICTPSQLGNWNQEGKTCGTAVAPATQFEWGSALSPPVLQEPEKSIYTLDKTIPEGMLFALDMTYAQIDAWVNSRTDLSTTRKNTARIFARAIKDYGMMVVDTNGGSTSIQTAGGINPDNAAKWTALGMGPDDKDDLLRGLITANNLYVVNPPEATCKNGTKSRYYCDWTSIRYTD